MNSRRIIPVSTSPKYTAIYKYMAKRPKLNWQNSHGFSRFSSWSNKPNICFHEDIQHKKMHLYIEFPIGFITSCMSNIPYMNESIHESTAGICLYFYVEENTQDVNILYRRKPLYGHEHSVLYAGCKYFGIQKEMEHMDFIYHNEPRIIYNRRTNFMVSNDWQDKTIVTDVNFEDSYHRDFHYVIDHINDFIQHAIYEKNMCMGLGIVSHAIPLLKLLRPSNRYRELEEAEPILEAEAMIDCPMAIAHVVDD